MNSPDKNTLEEGKPRLDIAFWKSLPHRAGTLTNKNNNSCSFLKIDTTYFTTRVRLSSRLRSLSLKWCTLCENQVFIWRYQRAMCWKYQLTFSHLTLQIREERSTCMAGKVTVLYMNLQSHLTWKGQTIQLECTYYS